MTTEATIWSTSRSPPPPRNTPSLATAALIAESAKKPEQQRADQAADQVDGDDVEAVVELERLLDAERQVADDAGDEADVDAAPCRRRSRRTA